MSLPDSIMEPADPFREKKPALASKAIIFLVIVSFFNTMGMTIIAPVVPFMTLQHLSSPADLAIVVAWMLSTYGICQFIAAPGLGLLSDRFGRRPILFICLFGSAIGYLFFGLGGSLWILFLGRIVDGLTGGNNSILFGYIADVTEPEERGKYFGLMGGFSGVGVIVGPAIGGLLATISYSAPFIVAAVVVMSNLIWGYFFLPESLQKEQRIASIQWHDLNPFKQLRHVFTIANLRWILIAGFLYALPFSMLVANLTVLLKDSLGWNATQAGLLSSLVGVADIFVQGILVGKLIGLFGDIKLSIGSLVMMAMSYILIGAVAFIASPIMLIVGVVLFAATGGLVENSLLGLTSRLAKPEQQGLVGGANQSMGSIAMIIGPLLGGFLYVQAGHAIPYWTGALVVIFTIFAVVMIIPAVRKNQ